MMRALKAHGPEYAIEAFCLAVFMMSAAGFAVLLQHPASPLAGWRSSPLRQRALMGAAMGLTAATLIYSPLGRRSGAHMNPAVTLTFLRLGKIAPLDAAAYIAAQFLGGISGITIALPLFAFLPADPSVNFVATMPGAAGAPVAFAAETTISFLLMMTVLIVSNSTRFSRFTGAGAAVLVAAFITFEAPLSGMSMNPARTFGSAIFAGSAGLWIYFTAPLLGMLAAAELVVRVSGAARVRCAKLHHTFDVRCIFHCGYLETTA